jgi:SNF2 family DNA or RNA helicase
MNNRPKAELFGDTIRLELPYAWRNVASEFTQARWDPISRAWKIPAFMENLKVVASIAGITMTNEFIDRLNSVSVPDAGSLMPNDPVVSMMLKPHIKPYKHQVQAFNLAMTKGNVAILHEQGCGKSLVTVGVVGARWMAGEVRRVIIVAPLSVLPVWKREFNDYCSLTIPMITLEGPVAAKVAAIKLMPSGIICVNYESVWREEVAVALKAWKPNMMICDESQRIKSPTSRQSKGVAQLGHNCRYRMILSGTPVMNGPIDFWAQYRFLEPDLFSTSFYAFKSRYAVVGGYENHQIVAYRHLDELVQKVHSIASRTTKKEALDLPETVDEIRYCELEPAARKAYKKLLKDSIAELDGGVITAPQVITRILRLQQITGGYVQIDEAKTLTKISDAKRLALVDTLEDLLDAGKKVVIFARFLAEVSDITNTAKKMFGEDAVVVITGAVDQKERGPIVDRFQTDPDCKVFIAQTATAGLGITLTAADTAIFYSCDYSYANHEQARARIHRIGQLNRCTYIYMVAEKTVDEDVLDILQSKKSMADLVVDNWRSLLKEKG